MHQIAMDIVHDEIVVPNPLARAILFFPGGAHGEQAPLRIIQGARTKLEYVDNVDVDPLHNEVFTAHVGAHAILVFNRKANGNVEPLRLIHGPKTKLYKPKKVVVDPINNLLVVANGRDSEGILIFKRTDDGDVTPQAVASTDLDGDRPARSRIAIYPEGRKFLLGSRITRHREEEMRGDTIFVWEYTAEGDEVRLWGKLQDSSTSGPIGLRGFTLNPAAQEIITLNYIHPPALHVYHVPEVFENVESAKRKPRNQ
jgi:DNA-binding beta-propeller fold protein YncE